MKRFLQTLSLLPNNNDISALSISFLIINAAFLYHSLNFMWGNHDVAFVKGEVLLNSGLFEGRFTQFIPHFLLTGGQILPVLNNIIGFAFLTFALWILAKYWQIPPTRLNYVLFISFFATQPYTLSWMYFTFITISCLLWTLLSALGLYLSTHARNSTHKKTLCLVSILCFYLSLGGYPPVINMLFVCLCGKMLIEYVFQKNSLQELFHMAKYALINIVAAAVLFKITLWLITPENVYNLETVPLNALPQKFLYTVKIALAQFLTAVPFMEKGYKTILAAMCLCSAVGAILANTKIHRAIITLFLLFITVWTTALTTFLVIPHTEYVSRIDFYGFAFLYAFFLALLLKYKSPVAQSLALAFMLILIPFNIINDYRAQKVWKLGTDAEFQILSRITERIEQHPNFSPSRKYRFHQIGDITLRPQYYQGKYDIDDVFLLTLPYLAMWQGKNLIEFYSPYDYIDNNAPLLPSDITPEVYDFFMSKAKPWPHKNAIFVNKDIIVIILNANDLNEFQNKLRQIMP